MGRSNLPPHARAMIPAAEKPSRQIDQNRKLTETTLIASMSEREFQTHVLALAKRLGWSTWHDAATNAPRVCYSCKAPARGPRNASGLPDLILVRGDRIVWAELKRQTGSTTKEQREWIHALRMAGQRVFVWRPADWPTIESVLT